MVRRRRAGTNPYKPTQPALDRIEAERRELGIAVSVLADRAGIPGRTLRRIRTSGRAWDREVRALRMALRNLKREFADTGTLFPEDTHAA